MKYNYSALAKDWIFDNLTTNLANHHNKFYTIS